MDKEQINNMSKIDEFTYVVRSEAGFRKALKDFRGNFDNSDDELDNYPKTYPALIVLNNQYNGGNYINTCKVYPLHLLKQIVDIMENT